MGPRLLQRDLKHRPLFRRSCIWCYNGFNEDCETWSWPGACATDVHARVVKSVAAGFHNRCHSKNVGAAIDAHLAYHCGNAGVAELHYIQGTCFPRRQEPCQSGRKVSRFCTDQLQPDLGFLSSDGQGFTVHLQHTVFDRSVETAGLP